MSGVWESLPLCFAVSFIDERGSMGTEREERNGNFKQLKQIQAIESVFQIIFITSMTFAYMYIEKSKTKIYRMMARMWYNYNEDIQNIILVVASKGYLIASIQAVLVVISCTTFASAPVAVPLLFTLISSGNGTFEKKLPLHEEFLVDEHKYFYILFAFQLIRLADFGLLASALIFFYYSILVGVIGGIRGLKHSLKKMDAEYSEQISTCDENADKWICLQLTNFIRHHQTLIDFYEFARELFDPIMFTVLVGTTSGIILATTSMVVSMDTDFRDGAKMMIASGITIMTIIFACAPSQMLKNTSDDLFLTSCKLNYQNYPPKVRRICLFIMMKAEKSFALTAGPLVELNFDTCSTIIKSSFSYAAAFRSVYTSK